MRAIVNWFIAIDFNVRWFAMLSPRLSKPTIEQQQPAAAAVKRWNHLHNSQFPGIVTNSRMAWTLALSLRYQAQRVYILRIIKFGAGRGSRRACGRKIPPRRRCHTGTLYASLFSVVHRTYNRSQSHVEQTRSSTGYACNRAHRYGTVSFIFQNVSLKFSDLLALWKIVCFPTSSGESHRARIRFFLHRRERPTVISRISTAF